MKITDMLVSAILKNGILYEAKNCDIEFEIPSSQDEPEEKASAGMKIRFTADHMTLTVEKQ